MSSCMRSSSDDAGQTARKVRGLLCLEQFLHHSSLGDADWDCADCEPSRCHAGREDKVDHLFSCANLCGRPELGVRFLQRGD